MHKSVWVVLVIGAFACGGGGKAPATTTPENSAAPDCASAAGAIVRALGDDETKSEAPAATTAVTKRCADDKWTAEAVNCFGAAHDKGGVHDCGYQHLTGAQADKLDEVTKPLSAMSWPRAMKKMAEFRDHMCACKDAACAEKVSDEMTKWSMEMSKQYKDPPKLNDQEIKQATEIGETMGKCMQTAMGMGQSTGPAMPAQPLSVTGIDPPKGDVDGGTYVKISGTNFVADGPRNVKVYFGKKQGTVVRFASDSELIVEAPGGKAKEVVDVLVIFDPGGEMKLPKAFTYVKKK
jgi:hypothetical protein